MPYWQYKKLQEEEKCGPSGDQVPCLALPTQLAISEYKDKDQTTGITPMVEKNISFGQSNTSSVVLNEYQINKSQTAKEMV